FLSIPLGDQATDNKTGLTVKLDVQASAQNTLGGWSIDDLAITGIAIPPPPPPVTPPPTTPPTTDPTTPPTPDPTTPPTSPRPTDPSTPTNPTTPSGQDPTTNPDQPSAMDPGSDAPGSFSGKVDGGCVCVASTSRAPASSAILMIAGLAIALVFRRRK